MQNSFFIYELSESISTLLSPSHNAVPLSRILAPTKRRISESDAQKREDTDEENGEVSNRPQPGSSESLDRPYQGSHTNSGLKIMIKFKNRYLVCIRVVHKKSTILQLNGQIEKANKAQVVKLVLEQVAKKSRSPSDSTEAANDSCNFCLVVVVGTRERRLKDNFALCRIQSPWNKGRLYVRRRSDLLAAVRYGNEALV
ncbi:unnamed protein product [Haemonchus placei]|uniref:Ras-associating domain-containing protein n=1 Tax=Haemonchus placei TaxID=6290 RepID=A0A3P7UQ03_HAEPC|nr:unnamed protein product [Haemonchus placei]